MTDPVEPALGIWWELPGGGPEPGETPEQAVVREVAEEAGVVIPPGLVGPAVWRRHATYRWLGRRRWSAETVHVVRLAVPPRYVEPRRTADEVGSLLGSAWLPLAELGRDNVRCYPGRLPELLPRVLAGEEVDEPFERWS